MIFTIIILFSGTIAPTLLIQEADALKGKGVKNTKTGSNEMCGQVKC